MSDLLFDETWRAPSRLSEPRNTEWNMRRVSVHERSEGQFWVYVRLESTEFAQAIGPFRHENEAMAKATAVLARMKEPDFGVDEALWK